MISPRLKLCAASSIAAAALVATFFLHRSTARPEAVEVEGSTAKALVDRDELRDEVGVLRRELQLQSAKIRAMQIALPAEATVSDADRARQDEDLSPESELSPAEHSARQASLLEERVTSEGRDSDWSVPAESQIYERLRAQKIDGIRDAAVTCAVTLCRIEGEVDSLDAREMGLRGLAASVPWDFDGYYHADPSNEHRVIFYVTRKNHVLPTQPIALTGAQPEHK